MISKKKFYTLVIVTLVAIVSVGLLQVTVINDLKQENYELKEKMQKLEQNQKPATDLYNENNKPCAGC